jgi:hypothetical protein
VFPGYETQRPLPSLPSLLYNSSCMQPAEAKLVERSLTGDLAAFKQIVDLYQT